MGIALAFALGPLTLVGLCPFSRPLWSKFVQISLIAGAMCAFRAGELLLDRPLINFSTSVVLPMAVGVVAATDLGSSGLAALSPFSSAIWRRATGLVVLAAALYAVSGNAAPVFVDHWLTAHGYLKCPTEEWYAREAPPWAAATANAVWVRRDLFCP